MTVQRWTGSVEPHEGGGFVAYGDYLNLLQEMEWRPMDKAPTDRVIQLAVEYKGERKTFPAEASTEDGKLFWMTTSGWEGWTRLHSHWKPTGWKPMASPHKPPNAADHRASEASPVQRHVGRQHGEPE